MAAAFEPRLGIRRQRRASASAGKLLCCAAATVFAAASAEARNEQQPVAAAVADGIESCVDASAIHFAAKDRHAVLESADARAASAAIVARYAVVGQHGLAPQELVLWNKPAVGWVYIALLVDPSKGGNVCFTATFSADRFELTPRLVEKYFGAKARLD